MATAESIMRPINVKLGKNRVIIDCILSCGFYWIYWVYLTWKQIMKSDSSSRYYPVWHTLALLVPIYGLFVMYRHFKKIKELEDAIETEHPVSPGSALGLLILASIFWSISARVPNLIATLILDIIGIAIIMMVLVSVQGNLNRYWEHVLGKEPGEARIGIGEVIIVLLGLLVWSTYLWY
jgi:hypothetical protein